MWVWPAIWNHWLLIFPFLVTPHFSSSTDQALRPQAGPWEQGLYLILHLSPKHRLRRADAQGIYLPKGRMNGWRCDTSPGVIRTPEFSASPWHSLPNVTLTPLQTWTSYSWNGDSCSLDYIPKTRGFMAKPVNFGPVILMWLHYWKQQTQALHH